MGPTDCLPLGNELGCAFDYFGKEASVLIVCFSEVGKKLGDDVVRQDFQVFMLLAVIEDFERAKANMRGCHPQQRCSGFDLFAIDPLVAPDDTERPCRWNAEPMHG